MLIGGWLNVPVDGKLGTGTGHIGHIGIEDTRKACWVLFFCPELGRVVWVQLLEKRYIV
jgi:hypothetical protein